MCSRYKLRVGINSFGTPDCAATLCREQGHHLILIKITTYLSRSSLRKSVISAEKLAQTEVVSRLLKASSDSIMKNDVIPAIIDNDVEFIQVQKLL